MSKERHPVNSSTKTTTFIIPRQAIISAYKDKKTGKWGVTLRYTDIDGKEKRRAKRGFLTKREAKEWETEYLSNLSNKVEIDMSLNEFYEVYLSDISNKLSYNTIKN